MQLRQTEEDTADVYKSTARENDIESDLQPGQTPAARRSDWTTKSETVPIGYRIAEALCVTVPVFLVMGISQFLFAVVMTVLGKNMSFSNGLPPVFQLLSFAIAATISIATGCLVGLLANRRTMVGSLIIANIIATFGWQLTTFAFTPMFSKMGWQFLLSILFSAVFGMITVTLTEIGVALYVARKIRKKP